MADFFYEHDGLEKNKSSLVLSPITAPSLHDRKLVEYYKNQITKIDDLESNLM